jgi:glucose/arabinose dehydrogenase
VLRATAIFGLLAVLGAGACSLLPERFAVNAPVRQLLFGSTVDAAPIDSLQRRISLPDGYSIGVFARGIRARMLLFTEAGDLLVSAPRDGQVWLLSPDGDGDGRADAQRVLIDGLDRPHGLAFHEGALFIAEGASVGRIAFDAVAGGTRGAYEAVVTGLPAGENHWTRTVGFGPDGMMYVAVGSSCNVCEEADPRRAAILRYRPDGSGGQIFASGLRNAVDFDWQPSTGDLYATDNGRDLLGDDFPPCELNRVVEGGFYGWPYANGDRIPDPDFGAGNEARVAASIPPAHAFRAHNAPLGISFVSGEAAPAAYRGAALVALHGSWNRTRKDGYRIVSLHWLPDGSIEERDFAVGFESDDDVIGRPVDVALGPDGAFYVSDDYAAAVYRIALNDAPLASTLPAARPVSDPLARLAPDEREAANERGGTLYEEHACYQCHEVQRALAGTKPIPLTGLARRYDVSSLGAFLKAPTPPMPAAPLDAAQRRDLAVHLLEKDPE